jgi:hypothetical protein
MGETGLLDCPACRLNEDERVREVVGAVRLRIEGST